MGSTCGIAPSHSLIDISPSIHPIPLNNSGNSISICLLNESEVTLCTSLTLLDFSTMSKFTLTMPNSSESSTLMIAGTKFNNIEFTNLVFPFEGKFHGTLSKLFDGCVIVHK